MQIEFKLICGRLFKIVRGPGCYKMIPCFTGDFLPDISKYRWIQAKIEDRPRRPIGLKEV